MTARDDKRGEVLPRGRIAEIAAKYRNPRRVQVELLLRIAAAEGFEAGKAFTPTSDGKIAATHCTCDAKATQCEWAVCRTSGECQYPAASAPSHVAPSVGTWPEFDAAFETACKSGRIEDWMTAAQIAHLARTTASTTRQSDGEPLAWRCRSLIYTNLPPEVVTDAAFAKMREKYLYEGRRAWEVIPLCMPSAIEPNAEMVSLARAQLMSVVKPGEDGGCTCGPCKLAREVLRLAPNNRADGGKQTNG